MGKGKYRFPPPYVCYSPSCTGHNKIASNIIALVSVQITSCVLSVITARTYIGLS